MVVKEMVKGPPRISSRFVTWSDFTGREELVFACSMDQTWTGPGAEKSLLTAAGAEEQVLLRAGGKRRGQRIGSSREKWWMYFQKILF